MVKFAIRIDWMNMKAELSPNLKVVDTKINGDRSTLVFELDYNPDLLNYPYFSFASKQMDEEEVYPSDEDSKWWKAHMDTTPDAQGGSSSQPSPVQATPQSNFQSAPPPQQAPVQSRPQSSLSPQEIEKLKKQLQSIQNIFANLQQKAAQGHISQEDFAQKQQILGEQMGAIMSKLDEAGVAY